jgi:hypothetical protein
MLMQNNLRPKEFKPPACSDETIENNISAVRREPPQSG